MKKTLMTVALAAAFLPNFAFAEEGDWVVRLRAVNVSPDESSSLGKYVNKNVGVPNGVPGLMTQSADLKVDDNVIPELDISYYITKNIAAELILALGTKHDVKIRGDNVGLIGDQNLGEVNLLPPTLTLQWHFRPDQTFDPYIGAGVNYTRMLDRNLKFKSGLAQGDKIKIENDSWGFVAQAGFDVNLKDGWLINADVKYVTIDTDVKMKSAAFTGGNWTKIDSLDIDPWVIGIGIGKRF
ncbi:MAG: OmpW family protein [Betaproteobacteria bacterium HGW-Betaproteobacteria-8]|nr:MAG: OmpW family protein [Betaproteobacteria bacterium HGW-Betaproteobacteria-8]